MTAPTHYFPWTEDEFAYCGHRMGDRDVHSPLPTCAACAARLDADDAAFADEPLPLDGEELRILDPILNAGIPERTPDPLSAELFALAVRLTRLQEALVRR